MCDDFSIEKAKKQLRETALDIMMEFGRFDPHTREEAGKRYDAYCAGKLKPKCYSYRFATEENALEAMKYVASGKPIPRELTVDAFIQFGNEYRCNDAYINAPFELNVVCSEPQTVVNVTQ